MKYAIHAIALAIGLAFAFAAAATGQEAGTKTCTWAGQEYQPGEKVSVGDDELVCDGTTGEWVRPEASE